MSGVLVVTGSSQGIGAATAKAAAKEGYNVCVSYRSGSEKAETVVNDIEKPGSKAISVQVDVADPDQVEELFNRTEKELGSITGLVNNAGILGPCTPLAELEFQDLQHVFMTNAMGPFNCARLAVRRMSTKFGGKGGVIVNISSVLAKFGAPGEIVHYAATKGAVEVMTKGLALEVAQQGIRVNAVRPGLTETDMFANSSDADRIARVAPNIPMQRAARPDEIAEAVIWLLSDKASYVTGSTLDVGGGR